MSDRLTLANAIEDAGIERGKAERVASVIIDAIHDNVATKADVALSASMLRGDIALVRTELGAEIREFRLDLARLEHRLMVRGLGALVTGLGGLFAALHYWPPHG